MNMTRRGERTLAVAMFITLIGVWLLGSWLIG